MTQLLVVQHQLVPVLHDLRQHTAAKRRVQRTAYCQRVC
jgi:hypothetical protein